MPRFVTLKLYVRETSIKVSTIDENKKEEYIQLVEGKEEYPLSIKFDKNEIHVCQEEIVNGENSFNGFMKDLFDNPIDYKRYSFEYQNRHYMFFLKRYSYYL